MKIENLNQYSAILKLYIQKEIFSTWKSYLWKFMHEFLTRSNFWKNSEMIVAEHDRVSWRILNISKLKKSSFNITKHPNTTKYKIRWIKKIFLFNNQYFGYKIFCNEYILTCPCRKTEKNLICSWVAVKLNISIFNSTKNSNVN